MNEDKIILNTINFVKKTLTGAEGGHDWFHTERVYKNAILIAKTEKANGFIVTLGALLHDIADSKFHPNASGGNETIGPELARQFLSSQKVETSVIEHVVKIIENISFKSSLAINQNKFNSIELEIVQDADRLDAIGAIGIARCFNYGGFKNREIYNPNIKPNLNMTKEQYKKSTAPTINHFYEKLLLLKDKMNTNTGKNIAKKRHIFMEDYLNQFFAEWQGEL